MTYIQSKPAELPGVEEHDVPPVQPAVMLALLQTNPSDGEQITHLLQAEPVLSARVLAVVNSALFALRQPVRSIPRAVALLGPPRARSLAMVHALRLIQQSVPLERTVADRLWSNTITRALAARALAEVILPGREEEAFALAMLQDLALPIMVSRKPRLYEGRPVDRDDGVDAEHFEWLAAEQREFGIDHAELSAGLLSQWGAPAELCDAVARHHRTPAQLQGDDDVRLHLTSFFAGTLPHVDDQVTGWQFDWLHAIHARFLYHQAETPDRLQARLADQMNKEFAIAPVQMNTEALVSVLIDQLVLDVQRLTANLCRIETVLEDERAELRDFRSQAMTDALTRLLNRRGFATLAERFLEELRAGTCEGVGTVCCMLADLDDFKSVNDRHGHDVGDQVLRAFANALRDLVGSQGVVGRIGGDEFAVMMIGAEPKQIDRVVHEFEQMVQHHQAKLSGGLTLPLRASMGVVCCTRLESGTTLDHLLNAADQALYQQKRGGKCGVTLVRQEAAQIMAASHSSKHQAAVRKRPAGRSA